jgi:NADPH:quinone reductase-like Zn-dependent oxidoreductase
MAKTMKAVRIHEYGGADVLRYEDAPCPDLAPGEVLVKVYAAGINPVDWNTRAGRGMAGRYGDPFPLILGWDVSGVVETVAPGVTDFKPGDEVFGMVRFPEIGSAYAEYVAAPQEHFILKPNNIDHLQAAAIPLAALTAWQGLFEAASLSSGQRLLIQGAAGGVGHLAVQIAKWKGAYVIGTSSTSNIDFLRTLGVDEPIDYTVARFEDAVAPVDMVLDTVGGETLKRSLSVVRDGGTLITIAGGPDKAEAEKRHVHAGNILVHTEKSQLAQIATLIVSGQLKTVITHVFPLTEVVKAHETGANRELRRGKIVLQVHA